jgi:hypothetical protein
MPAVTSMPDLVALLYRADWTRLSMSARVTWQQDRAIRQQLHLRMDAQRPHRGAELPEIPDPDQLPDPDEPDEPRTGLEESEHRVLLAPGERYRVEARADGDASSICDGESRWRIHAGTARRQQASGPDSAFHGLLTPRWLLTSTTWR